MYTTDKVILLGNWNGLDPSTIKAIESVAEVAWLDEWVVCSEGRAFRRSPDSAFRPCSFFMQDGDIVPYDTLPQDGTDLCDALRGYGFFYSEYDTNVEKVVPPCIGDDRLATFATLQSGGHETGWYPGQTDQPEKILAELPPGEYFIRVRHSHMFATSWQVWRINDVLEM